MIEYISTLYALDERVCLSYVYYDYRDETLQNLSLVISGIMKQACRQLDEIPDWMLRYKEDYRNSSDVCTTDAFCKVGQSFEKIIVIVDALDECLEERHKAIDFINSIVKNSRAKVLVTYRKQEGLLVPTEIARGRNIEIQPGKVADDMKTFIAGQVKKLRQKEDGEKLYLDDDSLEDAIVETLADKSEGR